MNRSSYLAHRAAFCGIPPGELLESLERFAAGEPWEALFLASARRLRRWAERRDEERLVSARSSAEAWLAAASAYQVSGFGMHLEPEAEAWGARIVRERRLARLCYRRALALDPALGRPIRIPAVELEGYLRRPAPSVGNPALGTVVLVNGLDSICEVELHRFGDRFLARGFSVLALDLPATSGGSRATAGLRAERLASAIASWVDAEHGIAGYPLSAFGVSFGGQVAARLLAGSPRFGAAVSISGPAWFAAELLGNPRIRRMFSLAFDLREDRTLAAAADLRVEALPPPAGRLLVVDMTEDELFDLEHAERLLAWANRRGELRRYEGEHVGTSRMHRWLPEVCDWLTEKTLCQQEDVTCAS